MDYRRFGDTLLVRIDHGEEILEQVKTVALKENIQLASVQALGALGSFTVGVYKVDEKKYYANSFEGSFEIVSLTGTIDTMNGEFYTHLHLSAGNDRGEVFGAAKEHGVLLEEAYAYRHAQLVQKVKEIVDSGAIGRIRYLESKHSTFDTNRSGIRYQKGNGGGAVYDVTCYNVSLASYLFGKDPEDMSVYCGFDKETGVDVSDAVMLRYEEGVTAMLYAGLDAYRRGCYSILGETGRIDVDHKFNSSGVCHIRVSTGARPQGAEYVDETTTEYTIWVDDNYKKEIELFSDAVLNGSALTVSEEESLRTARVCDAIRRAGGID